MSLILEHIDKSFGEKQVLSDFSLTLAEGEHAAILGPSGSGKSTLLRLIAGLEAPDSGSIRTEGGHIGYVFQEDRLLPWLTAEENLTAVTDCTRETARELLDAVELHGEYRTYPDILSGGMRQRVNIARALAFAPDLLLLDEPFKGLDEALRARVAALLLARHTGTLLLVTHDRRECELLACQKTVEFC